MELFKTIFASKQEFEEALHTIRKTHRNVKYDKCKYSDLTDFNAYLDINKTVVHLYFKSWEKPFSRYEYIFRLDGSTAQAVSGLNAYRTLKKYWPELPNLTTDPYYGYFTNNDTYGWKYDPPCSGIIGFNPKFENKRTPNCISYDINSAFAFAMLNKMPDTSKHPKEFSIVKENEIGFTEDINGNMTCKFKGQFCEYVFPLIDSPFKEFVNTWYNRKKNAKNDDEKAKAKAMLTHSVGYLQRINPFLRGAIIYYSNEYIKKFIDENTLYWNTDSIVSCVQRPDIESNLGTELGQWKITDTGDFALKNSNYQWNKDIPTIRGVPKKWFKDFDILKDKVPSQGNIYYIDEKFYLRRIKNEKF